MGHLNQTSTSFYHRYALCRGSLRRLFRNLATFCGPNELRAHITNSQKPQEMIFATFSSFIFIFIVQPLHGRYFPYVHAQVTPFRPNAVPLAVKTPYTNFWLLGGPQGYPLGESWPTTVTGSVSSSLSASRWVSRTELHQRIPELR
jgi:hypothetical protein